MEQMTFLTVHGQPLIRDLPATETPVNRLRCSGPTALSTTELVASILKGPNALYQARQVVVRFGRLIGIARASLTELESVVGVGPSKGAQLRAVLELGRRLLTERPEAKPQVRSPADAAALLMAEMGLLGKEHLRGLLLDTKNHVPASPTVRVGRVNTTLIRVADIFLQTVKTNCEATTIAHNHPSGNPLPHRRMSQ
jgi:DNA repair protein RadC